MKPALRHLQLLCTPRTTHPVHQPIFQRHAPGPPAFEITAQWFRLSGSSEGRALAFLDQVVQPQQNLRIVGLPMQIVFPCAGGEDEAQAVSFR
jgi:hypothetical protein